MKDFNIIKEPGYTYISKGVNSKNNDLSQSMQDLLDAKELYIVDLYCCGAKFFSGINCIYSTILALERMDDIGEKQLFIEDVWHLIDYLLECYEVSILSCILAEYHPTDVIEDLNKYKPCFFDHLNIDFKEICLNRNTDNYLSYLHFITQTGQKDEYEEYEERYEYQD